MIKAVIFDLGGTLVKSEDAYISALFDTLDQYKIRKPEMSVVRQHVGKSDREFITNCLPKKYRTKENIDKYEKWFNSKFPKRYLNRFVEIEETREILEYLYANNIKIAIATGWERWKANMILISYEWSKYKNVLITREDFAKIRPAPDVVLAAIEKLGVKNDECIYVDDTINGAKSGVNAKEEAKRKYGVELKVVTVLTGAQGKEIEAKSEKMLEKGETDFIGKNVSYIKDIIEKTNK